MKAFRVHKHFGALCSILLRVLIHSGLAFNSINVPFTGLDEQLFIDCGLADAVYVDLNTEKGADSDENAEHGRIESPAKPADLGAADRCKGNISEDTKTLVIKRDSTADEASMEFTSSSDNPIPSAPTPPLTSTSITPSCSLSSSSTSLRRDLPESAHESIEKVLTTYAKNILVEPSS